jgi:translation initiation factor 2 subunit 1
MFHKKTGFPENDETVLCTVTNVQYNSVFCTLDEYVDGDGRPPSGMIHISEVSAGRIRNIREFVQENKKVVCKVLAVDKQRGHIDLSLRRVGEGQRRDKNLTLKQEQKAENILDHIAKEHKQDPAEFYAKVAPAILEHYEYIFMAFEDLVEDKFDIKKTSLDAKTAKLIEDAVRERIKPKQVNIEGVFSVTTYAPNGVQLVRNALIAASKAAEDAEIRYLGAGTYRINVTAEEFKDAERKLKAATTAFDDAFKKVPHTEAKFERTEVKSH